MKNKIQELYTLEQLSNGNTCIHRLHPLVKLLASVVFIITVVSFDKYAFGRLLPYIFYPLLLMALSETPYSMLIKRGFIALPFCLFAGLTNMIFDRTLAFAIGSIGISYGIISFFTLLFRTYLCVMAVLILVSVTPLSELTNEMRRLKIPNILIIIFEMTYRYIGVLLSEAYSMYIAYSLRSTNKKGIEIRDMGSFIGQLLLKSFDRAERVYSAMKCRGYAIHNLSQSGRKLKQKDIIFFIIVCLVCITFRFVDGNALIVRILGGWM